MKTKLIQLAALLGGTIALCSGTVMAQQEDAVFGLSEVHAPLGETCMSVQGR